MIQAKKTYTSILLTVAISLLSCLPVQAQKKMKAEPETGDTIATFQGLAVSVDAYGAVQRWVSSYGQYEAALRANIKGRYFPVIEFGIGQANEENDVTAIRYKTSAPYGRIGIDFNLLKNKLDDYRFYAGARYAYTSFKYDMDSPDVKDPVWGNEIPYQAHDVKCFYHWAEFLAGIDVKIAGPFRMGWSVRYRRRLVHDHNDIGEPWYVPGFGRADSSNINGTFNLIFEL